MWHCKQFCLCFDKEAIYITTLQHDPLAQKKNFKVLKFIKHKKETLHSPNPTWHVMFLIFPYHETSNPFMLWLEKYTARAWK